MLSQPARPGSHALSVTLTRLTHFDYTDGGFLIRPRAIDALRNVWSMIAKPGSHWSGEQRVAIAEQARAARIQRMQPPWLRELPDAPSSLPPAAVETARRIAADPAKIERAWAHEMIEQLSDAAYVELAAVTNCVCAIDTLADALGVELEALPAPEAGEPDGARNPSVADVGAHVPLQEPWDGGPNVARALSLVPASNAMFMSLVMSMYGGEPGRDFFTLEWDGPISRPQAELLASRVSAVNECFY